MGTGCSVNKDIKNVIAPQDSDDEEKSCTVTINGHVFNLYDETINKALVNALLLSQGNSWYCLACSDLIIFVYSYVFA